MSRAVTGTIPSRRTVRCVNEECPEVSAKGRPWEGQRPVARAVEAPCPKCSSAVVVVATGERPPELQPEEPTPAPPLRVVRSPYMGVPRFALSEVRVGMAARQRLAQLAVRGKTLEQAAAEILDAWAAGTLEPPGAA